MLEELFNKFYGHLDRSEYWEWELQADWARHAIEMYIHMVDSTVFSSEELNYPPYDFTKQRVYEHCYLLVVSNFTSREFIFTANCKGGIIATYVGLLEMTFSIEVSQEYNTTNR